MFKKPINQPSNYSFSGEFNGQKIELIDKTEYDKLKVEYDKVKTQLNDINTILNPKTLADCPSTSNLDTNALLAELYNSAL